MNREELVRSLSMPLPEDIRRRSDAGDLTGAVRAIDARLEDPDLPRMLRARLTVEKERLRRLPTQYRDDRAAALARLRQKLPELTEADFDRWEDLGYMDSIRVDGEKRYFVRNAPALLKRPEIRALTGEPLSPANPWLDGMIARIKGEGALSLRITLDASLSLAPEAFVPGTYRAWMPFPAASAQQHDIVLLSGDPDFVSPADAPARTVYWERKLDRWEDFAFRFAYTGTIRYADPLHAPAPAEPLYPAALPVCPEDLEEQPPFLRLTPYLKDLAARVAEGRAEPAEKAWACYEFVTTKVKYAFVRDYFQIDDLGEFCAVNGKGDCGLQALLFILLCRANGIPARWQSGASIDEDSVGSHDWAQFWLPGWGWLFADPSYGGSAWRSGAAERHAFYFGNLDPARLAANRVFQAELEPAGEALRVDPYDNQSGELERVGAALPFTGRDLDGDFTVVSLEAL